MSTDPTIPNDATTVAICSCGARAWATDGADPAETQEWFDDWNARHADCDTDAPVEHTDPARPEFGYIADDRDFFFRAYEALNLARRRRDGEARVLADQVLTGGIAADVSKREYRRAVAAQDYAAAVYEVHAAPIRERRTAAEAAS